MSIHADEMKAAFSAAKAVIDKNVPGFERLAITDAMIMNFCEVIVEAVDKVRATEPSS